MPIKRLTYPAYPRDATDDRGINTRLGEAHVHENGDALQQLTLSDIEDIRRSLHVDWSNLSPVAVDKLKQLNLDAGFVTKPSPIQSNVRYVYTKNGWQNLTESSLITITGSSEVIIQEIDPNKFTVSLSPAVRSTLSSVANKVDKVTSALADDIVLFGSGGALKDSGVNLSSLERVSNKSSSITSDSEVTYATSKAVKTVNDKLEDAIENIGKLRGSVYNAFAAQAYSYTITSLVIESGGFGYKTGDKFGVIGDVDAELTAQVDSSGTVIGFEIDNGGMFSEIPFEVSVYPKSSEAVLQSGQQVFVKNVTYDSVLNSTLRDIDNPKLGDTCYVNYDELHDFEKSLYTYKAINEVTNGWVYTSCVAAFPLIHVCSLSPSGLIGLGFVEDVVQGITSKLVIQQLDDQFKNTSYTYALERNGEQVITWKISSVTSTINVIVATPVITAAGNRFCVYDGNTKLCEARIYLTTIGDQTEVKLRLVA